MANKDKKNAVRAGMVVAGTALLLMVSSPAFASVEDDGADPGPGLSIAETLGLFVAVPLALFLAIIGLVILGDKSHKKQSD